MEYVHAGIGVMGGANDVESVGTEVAVDVVVEDDVVVGEVGGGGEAVGTRAHSRGS